MAYQSRGSRAESQRDRFKCLWLRAKLAGAEKIPCLRICDLIIVALRPIPLALFYRPSFFSR